MEVLFIMLVGEGDGRVCVAFKGFFVECCISFNLVSNFRLFCRLGDFREENIIYLFSVGLFALSHICSQSSR